MERRDFLKDCLFTGIAGAALSSGLIAPGTAFARESGAFEATSVDAVFESKVRFPKERGGP